MIIYVFIFFFALLLGSSLTAVFALHKGYNLPKQLNIPITTSQITNKFSKEKVHFCSPSNKSRDNKFFKELTE